jgi:hypothetical protein
LWGSRPWIEATFGPQARAIVVNDRSFVFRYRSPAHFVAFFRDWYGPVHKAFLALGEAGRDALAADLMELVGRCNTATDGPMRVPSAYAEIVITKG